MNKVCLHNAVIVCLGLSISAIGSHITFPSQIVIEGHDVKLYCNTTELHDVERLFWTRNVTDGSSKMSEHSWKLEITAISRSAAGIYYCHAELNSTGENVTLSTTEVDVWYPAEIRSMSVSEWVIFANQTYAVNCSVRANPSPTWSIFNNVTGEKIVMGEDGGIQLSKSGATYRIHNQNKYGADVIITNISAQCGDTGFLLCSGYNELNRGNSSTISYTHNVLCSPQPTPFYPSDHVYTYKARVGDNITMSLNVSSYPYPNYGWRRMNGASPRKPFYQHDTPNGTSLTLQDVRPSDYGKWKLWMMNIYGTFYAHFELQAHGAPGKPTAVKVTNITDCSADLSWISGYDMGSQQQFYIVKWVGNQFIQISDIIKGPYVDGGAGKFWRYRQAHLDADADYKLAVVAQNADDSIFSDPVNFNTTSLPGPISEGSRANYIGAIVGGTVGLVVIVVIVIIVVQKRKSPKFIDANSLEPGKNRLLQSIQSEYGGNKTAGSY